MGASVLLRRGNKILMGAKEESHCGTQTEGKAKQIIIFWTHIDYN